MSLGSSLFIKKDESSLRHCLGDHVCFKEISGLKIDIEKTKAVDSRVWRDNKIYLCWAFDIG